MQPIDYGMFIMPFHYNDKSLAQCLDEDLELIVKAEELGFSEFWVGEHHAIKCEFMMPEIFIGRAIGETSRIRLGPAPICLPQHHPARAANQLAFLDHLSKGRLNLAFGPGSAMCDLELFGLSPKNAPEMTEEAMNIILQLWSTDPPYEVNGKYWQFSLTENIDEVTTFGQLQKPLQQPHPPIAMPATSRNSPTMQLAGRRGYEGISNCLVPGNVIANMWQTYHAAAEEVGRVADPSKFKIAKAIFLADTTKDAERIARENSLGQNFKYICRVFDQGFGRKMFKRDLDMSDQDCDLDYLFSEQIIAASPDDALKRLLDLVEEAGPFGTLILMSYDWDDKAGWIRSMELFAHELMPSLNKALGSAAA